MRALKYLCAILLLLPAVADAQTADSPAPGNENVIATPYTPEERAAYDAQLEQAASQSDSAPSDKTSSVQTDALRSAGGTSAQGPLSISELARALKNDPDLIYDYVRDNIETYPIWGVQKGGVGALIDGTGTAWDQADLMVKLLTQAGYTASYIQGKVDLSATEITSFYGIPTTNVCATAKYFKRAGLQTQFWTTNGGPFTDTTVAGGNCTGALQKVSIDHVWVKVSIDGTNYVFDPAHKPHDLKNGINLTDLMAATGYNPTTFLDRAKSGATIDPNFVQNINRANIRTDLTGYSNNLINYVRTNTPAADLDDVIGGKTITQTYGGSALRQTVIPYETAGATETPYSGLPDPLRVRLNIKITYAVGTSISSTARNFWSDEIYGHRLSIVTSPGVAGAAFYLDGFQKQFGSFSSTPAAGAPLSVQFNVTARPYSLSTDNHPITQTIKFGGLYVVSNGWGPTSRGLVQKFHKDLEDARASGAADGSEAVLGSSLAVLSANWLAKADMAAYIANRLTGTDTYVHQRVGIAGYYDSPYVDLTGNVTDRNAQDGDANKETTVFFASGMHESIFESNAVQETAGISAVSTVKLIDIASLGGQKIFDANSINYSSAVEPNLVACSAYKPQFQSLVGSGFRLILPEHCDLAENSWSGEGYFETKSNVIGAVISGGLLGGLASGVLDPTATASNTLVYAAQFNLADRSTYNIGGAFSVEPIDLFKGNYLYAHDDINIGVGDFPHSLKFQSIYNSGAARNDGPMGLGWTHNLAITAKTRVDGFQGMGEDSPIDAAATIAELMVSLDLLSDATKPLAKLVTATLAQRWFADQLLDNTVVVTQGNSSELFVKLPDGSYNPPQGSSAKLIQNGDGTFTYSSADKIQLNFDSLGNVVNWIYPNGARVNFTYDMPGGKLINVANSLGRSLTLSYTGTHITSVSDGSRSIGYGYDSSGNLTSFTDAALKTKTFQYDPAAPGRMTKFFLPAPNPTNPTNPAMINTYDSLGRVQTQTSSTDKLWNYFFAGSRSEEVAPDNARLIHYFNATGDTLAKIDNLLVGDPLTNGRKIVNKLDGRDRVIEVDYPEGNKLKVAYDDASCASADKRCTHNILERRLVAKTSGPADIVATFTYEGSFNKVLTATDARGKVTNYDYNPANGNLISVTSPAAASGGTRPQTSLGYSTFTGIGGLPSFTMPTSVTKNIDASTTVIATTAYDPSNHYVPQTSTVDPTGLNLVTAFTYDAMGNLIAVDGPRTDVADVTQYAYDGERRPTQITDAAGRFTRMAYDADGNPIRTSKQAPGGLWLAACKTYNFADKVSQARGPTLVANDTTCPGTTTDIAISDYAYDDQDRLMRVTQNQPAAQGGNRVTETTYFPDDQVKQIKRGVGSAVAQNYATYTYTANGKPRTLTDAKGQLTTYAYDEFDRLKALQYPTKIGVGTSAPCNVAAYTAGDDCEVYAYDKNSNLLSKRTRAGQTIAYDYDDLNRVKQKTRPDAANNVSYAYDLLDRVTSLYQDSAAVQRHPMAYTYDKAGRITQLTEDGWTSDYEYDAAGNRTLYRYPHQGLLGSATNDGFYLTYDYDLLNRVNHVRENGAASGIGVLASYNYDELSRATSVALGNGTNRTVTYKPDSSVGTVALDLDGAGAANDNLYTLAYNQIPQIASVTTTKTNFDWGGYNNANRGYTANGLNQYTQIGSTSYGYDDNGNLTTYQRDQGDPLWAFGYSAENELLTANASGAALAYRYDGLGRMDRRQLNSETAADYVYDGQSLIAEHAPSANPQTKRYVHGAGVDSPLVEYTRQGDGAYVRTWYAADFKGSIVATTNDAGITVAIYSYGDFGEPNTLGGTAFRYTGQRLDPDSGLYYYKARWYSPNLGRFLSSDPIGTQADTNLYAYVTNDPLNLNDPTGLRPLTSGELAIVSGVYNLTLDYSKIDIESGPSMDPRTWLPIANGYAVTFANTIHFPSSQYKDDFSTAGLSYQAWLIHEVAHIYQYQNEPNYTWGAPAIEGLRKDTYQYTLDPSKSFTDYRYEQQAQILQDYYVATVLGSPSVTKFEAILTPQGLGSGFTSVGSNK